MNPNHFHMDGITYRPQFNELGEIGGCGRLNGSDFQECKDCRYEGNCPADEEGDE